MPSKKSSTPEQLGLRFDVIGLVAGVDEAGRGPLAGPVVAAAVILDDLNPIKGLNDSKKLSPAVRERLFDEIRAKALCCAIAQASVEEIDTAVKLGLRHPMGPFELIDFTGLDINLHVANVFFDEFKDPSVAPPALLKRMVLAGRLGVKTGRGFYEYDEKGQKKK